MNHQETKRRVAAALQNCYSPPPGTVAALDLSGIDWAKVASIVVEIINLLRSHSEGA